MSTLPIELCIAILEEIFYEVDGAIDYPTLASCALISSSWTEAAQMFLFHSVSLSVLVKSAREHLFESAIHPSAEHGPILGSYVRRLRINLGEYPNSIDRTITKRRFMDIVSWCPKLYELSLEVYGIHELDSSIMAELQDVADKVKIRALHLLRFGVQSPIIYQLITVWPSIQFLTIGAEIVASPPSEPSNIQLYELMLFRSLIPSESLDWLLSGSETSLQIFELRDVPGQQMKNVVAKHGPHLRSLRMLRFNKDSAEILRLCTQLEELCIYHIPTVIQLKSLPTTIEHLSFRNPANAAFRGPIISLIETLPNLRVVTCDNNIVQHSDFPALRGTCDAKDVELRVYNLPFWIQDDPVITRRFPRHRSVSNFTLMNALS